MRVIISGATGFIGRALCRELSGHYDVVALSRDARRAARVVGQYARVVEWDARTTSGWAEQVDGAHAVVNLAGENIASGRWTPAKKQSILRSRSHSAKAVADAAIAAANKPAVVVQASAIGYYGSRGDEILDEDSPAGTGFLAEVCRATEAAARNVEDHGVRSVIIRTGAVLGGEGGALPKLMAPFRFCVGGYVGDGRQWFSWISLRDEVRAIRFLVENPQARGSFNLAAPHPVTMKEFSRVLGRMLHRPAWTVLPGFAARLALGQMADEVVLASQRVLPKRLQEGGFSFEHPRLEDALTSIFQGEDNDGLG